MTPDQRKRDLALLHELPALRVMRATHKLRQSIADGDPLVIKASLHALATDSLLRPAMRTWALIIAELGPPRLPGGALVERVTPNPRVFTTRDADPEAERRAGWYSEFSRALVAARDRDGLTLIDSITTMMQRPDGLISYAVSFAASACKNVEQTSARRGTVALLHLLGYAGTTGEHWSVCGPVYRLTAAFLAMLDMDGAGSEAVAPELRSVMSLDESDRLYALAVVASVAALIMGGNPLDPIAFEAVPALAGVEPDTVADVREQREAARIATEMIVAVRADGGGTYALSLNEDEKRLAVYGCANLLACRVYRLWGA